MADVGDLRLRRLGRRSRAPTKPAPLHPQVDGHDLGAFDAGLAWAAQGVGLRRVLSPQTLSIYPKFEGVTAREALGLAPGPLGVLVGYSDDSVIEGLPSGLSRENTPAVDAAEDRPGAPVRTDAVTVTRKSPAA